MNKHRHRLNRTRWEMRIVGTMITVLILMACFIAIRATYLYYFEPDKYIEFFNYMIEIYSWSFYPR